MGRTPTELEAVDSTQATALSFGTNISWTLAGNLVYTGCQWGMLVVIAKLGSPELVGQFALGLAVTAPIMMLSNLQLRGVLATDAAEKYAFADYLSLRLLTTALALIAMSGVVAVVGYQRETALVMMAIGLMKALENLSDIAYGFLQHRERMDRVAHSLILRGVSAVVAVWLGVYLTGSLLVGCLGVATAWAVVLITYDLRPARFSTRSHTESRLVVRPHEQLNWNWTRIADLALLAAPLGFVMMLISLNVNIPRYVIQHYSGERSLGIFAAVAYLMIAGTTVVGALGQSASPRLARCYARGDLAGFRRLILRLIAIGGLVGAAGTSLAVFWGHQILGTLFRPEYADAADVLVWMMAAAAIGYVASFLGYGLTAARLFKAQPPLFGTVTAVTTVAALILVPRYGLVGAAWAVLLGTVAQSLGSGLILWYAVRIQREIPVT
ncbi:MAG: oligosaccharide flippase family protein [Luteitalea sp.]|nr:oligosaccharide flippase family protein [Luteitalea sp.]